MTDVRRDASLDIARGLIVALMALDHVRIFVSGAQFDPLDATATTWGWYLVRWLTHWCAPGFFFIAGASAWLMRHGGMPRGELARTLVLRGVWLIALEIVLFGYAWSFVPGWFWLGVIWALGASMLLLAASVYVPRAVVFVAALAFTLLHDAWPPDLSGISPLAHGLLYGLGPVELPLAGMHLVIYPLLPWAALMLLGYASAPWWLADGRPVAARVLVAGAAMLVAFVVLRYAGIGQDEYLTYPAGGPLMQFLNVQKYPPSLQFTLVTLGCLALVLGVVAWSRRSTLALPLDVLRVYGRVPFFFYALHLFVIHGGALALAATLGWPRDYLFWHGLGPNLKPPDGYGFGLVGVLVAWFVVLAVLYPPCRRFGAVKARHPVWWMRLL